MVSLGDAVSHDLHRAVRPPADRCSNDGGCCIILPPAPAGPQVTVAQELSNAIDLAEGNESDHGSSLGAP